MYWLWMSFCSLHFEKHNISKRFADCQMWILLTFRISVMWKCMEGTLKHLLLWLVQMMECQIKEAELEDVGGPKCFCLYLMFNKVPLIWGMWMHFFFPPVWFCMLFMVFWILKKFVKSSVISRDYCVWICWFYTTHTVSRNSSGMCNFISHYNINTHKKKIILNIWAGTHIHRKFIPWHSAWKIICKRKCICGTMAVGNLWRCTVFTRHGTLWLWSFLDDK